MTRVHWYQADHRGEHNRAFTVRPDLWPPGTFAWTLPHLDDVAWVIEGAPRPVEPQPDTRYLVPGVAEAAILAGQVHVAKQSLTHLPWAEVAVDDPEESP